MALETGEFISVLQNEWNFSEKNELLDPGRIVIEPSVF